MAKFFKELHYRSKDKKTDIYINFYTTKGGFLKFKIEVYAEIANGFCARVANYNTGENSLLNFLKRSDDFILIAN